MITLHAAITLIHLRLTARLEALRLRREHGAETTEWVFIVVGALVIGGIIIAAVTSFVQGQIAKLPGQ